MPDGDALPALHLRSDPVRCRPSRRDQRKAAGSMFPALPRSRLPEARAAREPKRQHARRCGGCWKTLRRLSSLQRKWALHARVFPWCPEATGRLCVPVVDVAQTVSSSTILHRLLHFPTGNFAHMLGETPAVAFRVDGAVTAISIECVRRFLGNLCSGLLRLRVVLI